MSEGIVLLSNQLTVIDQLIDSVFDAQTAKDAVTEMDKLKKLLDLAEQYGNYASEFCRKEAEMYVRIAEIEGADASLTSAKRGLVNWIRSKKPDEISEILARCAEGCRISRIQSGEIRELGKKLQGKAVENEYNRIRSIILYEFTSEGRATVNPQRFYDEWSLPSTPDRTAAKAYTEKIRDDLIKRGGVGIADGIGTYVDPESKSRDELASAISARLRSIYADIKALAKLCKQSRFSIPHDGIHELQKLLKEMEEEICR
jgi:hypothetical protein